LTPIRWCRLLTRSNAQVLRRYYRQNTVPTELRAEHRPPVYGSGLILVRASGSADRVVLLGDNALPILFTVLGESGRLSGVVCCSDQSSEPNGGVLCACLPCLPPLFKTKRNKKSYVTPPTQRCQDTHRWTGRTKTSIGDLEDSSTTGIKPSSYIHLGDWDSSTAPMDLSITSERWAWQEPPQKETK